MRLATTLAAAAIFAAATAAHAQSNDWIEVPLHEGTFQELGEGFRTDVIDIPIEAHGKLEYKLALQEGNVIVYEWNALKLDDPKALYSEFHGHTERVNNEPGTLIYYRKASGDSESGRLTAPFTGIHGWYLVNGTDKPIVVRLKVAGVYELTEQD